MSTNFGRGTENEEDCSEACVTTTATRTEAASLGSLQGISTAVSR
jgi:hypothetical protein